MEKQSNEEIEQTLTKLLEDLKAVVRDGEELLKAGARSVGGAAGRERFAAALDAARETGRKLQERAGDSARATDRVIREHPYQSLGTAFGLGLLLGVLVNRG